ncbi:hypothetical protein R3P38DRAFT_3170665 [Favolaschia claudopus]|uniref:Uncharacterized protein n=1 Tax=Favolaschia claudopus TaxID=2862362 RepID=A0AAW0DUA5_9AGAR
MAAGCNDAPGLARERKTEYLYLVGEGEGVDFMVRFVSFPSLFLAFVVVPRSSNYRIFSPHRYQFPTISATRAETLIRMMCFDFARRQFIIEVHKAHYQAAVQSRW